MPFNVVKYKRGWRVVDDKGNYYSKKPLTKTNARQQQKALYASEARKQHLSGSGYASYVDGDGNHHILLVGEGFFGNVWTKIKQVGNYVSKTLLPVVKEPSLRTVSTALNQSVRLDYPPNVRDILARYGGGTIYNLVIVREPIQSYIDTALNFITAGKWAEAKKKYNYDKLFHLSMVASLSMPNGDKASIKLEKNEVINITDSFAMKQKGATSGSFANVSQHGSGLDAEFMPVPVACCITLFDLVNNARTAVGNDFFKYDAFYNNCQVFIINLLKYNNLLTPEIENFINQNAEQLLQELPEYTRPFANTITGIAGLANRIFKGEGEDELYGGCEGMSDCPCMEAKGTMNGGKLYCGLKETPPGDDKGNTYQCFKKGVGVGMMLEQQKPKPEKALEEMTIRELGQEASKRKVPGYGRMKKQELIDALRPLRGGMLSLSVDTKQKAPHKTTLTKEQIDDLRERIDFGDDDTKQSMWATVREVLEFLLSDKKYLQNYGDDMDITSALAEIPEDNTKGNPYSWANVIRNVLDELEPVVEGGAMECECIMDGGSVSRKETSRLMAHQLLRNRIIGGDREAPPGLNADGSWSGDFKVWQESGFPGCGPNSYYATNGDCYENCWEKEEPYSCRSSKEERDANIGDINRLSKTAEVRTAIQDGDSMKRYFAIENRKADEEGAKAITKTTDIPPVPKWDAIPEYTGNMVSTPQAPSTYTGFAKQGVYEPGTNNYNVYYIKNGVVVRTGLKPGATLKYEFDWKKAEERWNRLQEYDPNRPGDFATLRKDKSLVQYDSLGKEKFDVNRHGSVEWLNSVEGRHLREADPYFEELYQRVLEQNHGWEGRSDEEARNFEADLNSKYEKEVNDRYGENEDIYSPESNFTLTDKKGNKVRVNKVRLRKDGGYDIQFANGKWEYQAGEDEWDCNEWKKGDRIENYGVCGTEGRKKASQTVAQNINRERDSQWDRMSGWDKFVNGLSVAGSFTQDYILPVASTVLQFVPGVGQAISTGLDIAGAVAGKLTEGQCRHFNECSEQMVERGKADALYHRTQGDTVAERYLADENWAKLLEANKKVYGLVGDTAKYGSRAGKFYETGSGKPANEPLPAFKKQLKQWGITPKQYLEVVRELADEEGYDGRAVEFSDDPEKKLMIYDDEGKKHYFGAVNYGDYILWSKQEALGKVKNGFAEQKRRVFNASHNKIKGNWKADKYSPNNLALKILW